MTSAVTASAPGHGPNNRNHSYGDPVRGQARKLLRLLYVAVRARPVTRRGLSPATAPAAAESTGEPRVVDHDPSHTTELPSCDSGSICAEKWGSR